ncbi:cobalt-precorrin-5B (C(1))-methyltransferase [Aneurinibacillus thermoaerophilus]|uniref:Cobalt-precorrin-5B C(1)-methyltransferase n=1 Tax=Aneurinibacillus thermoaerophilus TaxID=143495 RepID=A0ABX8YBF9_ANETH|nr:cobalt-precorrin-5B (C(1))-methyltransferase [Aneurinibacillus thermoaerophilus]MED0676276.1 cobalt-precorrin-5B (C(1))-methyltransferase [Aneurinibacillus thermoaerophilus]MED0678667.1 cobalt-precorrin-5B (C(1))-methyltransferase [Aneurinibacillus thermoaerophilus]MED0736643.1 cobalt-precorrin-5B (C(1))-methyltransferase [Aneurinibacillus thermoaerophilus]MED0755821.1 cobalt-precorrin-5B (C(1))-methyltransferase [Aneurinibacillus thermoaerophilus]MED0759531.1 cobalt-precorrin-5B (C(1))-met
MADEEKTLRHGYTTGSNATAATKAALLSLIRQEAVTEAEILLPIGERVTFHMQNVEFGEENATAGVIKDAGDDPDATHKALIVSTVSWKENPGITLDGGVGVGRVTKPGLPVPVGEAAINPVPRRMIMETAQEVLDQYGMERGVHIVISVPDGEEIAKKTLNARLGIIGGISILGTRGTVVPFSTAAFKASIAQAIQVAVECGCEHVIATTGGRSEKFAMQLYEDYPEEAFIEMGDFVGFTLKMCKKYGVKRVTLVGMMGKFSKVAQGVMMVHSKSAPVDFGFLARVAEEAGVPEPLVKQIREANTASQVGDLMREQGCDEFFRLLCRYVCESGLKEMDGDAEIETVIITMKNEILGRERVDCRARSK